MFVPTLGVFYVVLRIKYVHGCRTRAQAQRSSICGRSSQHKTARCAMLAFKMIAIFLMCATYAHVCSHQCNIPESGRGVAVGFTIYLNSDFGQSTRGTLHYCVCEPIQRPTQQYTYIYIYRCSSRSIKLPRPARVNLLLTHKVISHILTSTYYAIQSRISIIQYRV